MAERGKPSMGIVTVCGVATAVAMAAGVYFGGNGNLPVAMTCSALFVALGGLTFELARRRSA
jgi:high-affinity Fe2+/Pb2+ permease